MTFTTEDAVSGVKTTGDLLDAAMEGNWAQVTKPGSLAEKKREGCTSLGCPEGSAAKHMGFTTEEAVTGVKTTGDLLDKAMEGGWAQVSKPGSLAEKKREGCTSLGCPEGSAAKNLNFTTEEAVQGTPITGKMLDNATANNWAQVNKSGNSTKDAAPKK